MKKNSITNTTARKNLAKQIGAKKLKELETIFMSEPIIQEKIVQTDSRKKLLKKLGKNKLEQLESQILQGLV